MKPRRILFSAAVLALACLAASESRCQSADHPAPATQIASPANAPSPAAKQKLTEEFGELPLRFEANDGQTDPQVKFLSRGAGYGLFLLPQEAVLILQRNRHALQTKKLGTFSSYPEVPKWEASPAEIIRMSLLGAAANAKISGVEQMPGKSNYFIGNDPSQWRTNVPNYAKVQYHGVYPGIDLIYHGSRQQLEYDFVVAPGVDPRQIRLAFKGAKRFELTREGDLLLATSGQPVRLYKPAIYQDLGGKRRAIDGNFVLTAKNIVKFRIGKYDPTQPLIIDPVLAYSTILGGNGSDEAFGIAVDATGAAYITGQTTSTDFSTTGGTPKTCGTPPNTSLCDTAFVAKLNFANNTLSLAYVAYLGGTGSSQGAGIAVFGGNAYVTGTTTAADFPTLSPFQSALKGSENFFVAELNTTGTALTFSTYLGGSDSEFPGFGSGGNSISGNPIAVDGFGNAYVSGTTLSGDFPTTLGAFQPLSGGGAFRSTDGATTWTSSLTGLTNRNISSFAVDPKTPANVYAGTAAAGVFKSVNGGASWAASGTTGLGTLKINTLAIDPVTPATLFAGTFIGVYKSIDGGATWAAANNGLVMPFTTTPVDVVTLAINPLTSATIYAGGTAGVFKSVDGGATWTSLNSVFPSQPDAKSIIIDPVTPATVYVGTQFPGGVFKTVDNGTTWAAASNGLNLPGNPTSLLDISSLAIDAKAPNNLYAINQNGLGVYTTSNGGLNWVAVNTGLTDLNTLAILADPTVSGTVYVGTTGAGVFKTTTGGASWTTTANALSNFIVGALAIDPKTPANLYAGSSVERAFIAKFSASGTIGYSTFLGGSSREFGGGIAVDSNGNAYITGGTESRNFPTLNPFQATGQSVFDAFVTELNPTGSGLVFSTYLGGTTGGSEGFAVAVDRLGSAYVGGLTVATNFPTTPNALKTVNGGDNAFITKFSPAGNTLVYSTYLGGSGAGTGGFAFDEPHSIAVDGSGNAWVSGFTESADFPVVNPLRASSTGNCFGSTFACQNIFISEVNPAGSALLFSTYFGPGDFFQSGGVALDATGNAYVAGSTSTSDFPTVNPLPSAPTSGVHGFVLKLANVPTNADLSITLSHAPEPALIGGNLTFTATVKNNSSATTATGVTLYPTIAPDVTNLQISSFTSATSTVGTCDMSTGFCNLGPLAPGASATITLVDTPFVGGTFTAAFGVGGNESDPIPTNNIASNTVTVVGAVDLNLIGSASPAPVAVNGTLTYLLLVNNKGPDTATGVTLSDTLPQGLSAISATPSQGTCTGGTTVVCSLGTIVANPVNPVSVTIVVTAPGTAGTITNNTTVAANENDTNPKDNTFLQISDVVALNNTTNNARLKGNYAFLFQGATADALMAFAGSFVADGNGNLTNGISDTNTSSGVLTNQAFTGTYTVGSDNRGTMIITPVGVPAQTYRFALGAFNTQGVATKARFIDFDPGLKGASGVIEMQDPTAFSTAALNGNFAFGLSGEGANANHFAVAGRFTADGAGIITNGLEDTDNQGNLSASETFTGTYAVASNGRGTSALTFAGNPGPTNFAFYMVSANEALSISTDPRTAAIVLSSGQLLKQKTAAFSNASLNGTGVFNLSGTPTGNTETDVNIGLLTSDGAGNATVLSDENNAGVVTLNQSSISTYSVASNGRTTFAGGGGNSPILYLVDLNKGFLVGTDINADTGSLEPQVGAPFSNASVSGSYFLGDLTPNALSVTPVIGEGSVDGVGNFAFTEDGDITSGTLFTDAVFSGTYTVSSNGRTLLGDGGILYLVSPTKLFSIRAKSGKIDDLVTVTESSALPGAADVAITNTAPSTATTGIDFNYTVIVKNNGPGQATGVTVTDSFPAGLSFVGATASQGPCTFTPPTLTCTVGTMAVNATVTVNITVTPTATGTVTDTASVTATTPDPNTANNSASATTTVSSSASADLALTKTASVTTAHIGQAPFSYTITVTNNGPSPATGIALNDPLPAGVQLVSAPLTTQGTCNANTPISCALGNLANGASATVTITVQAAAIGTAVNTATVSANEPDPNPANNSASATVQIQASADLSILNTAQPNPVNAGSPLTYKLVVTNNGPNPATGVTVTDPLPATVTFVSASPAGICSGTTTITCAIGNLAVNASATVTLVVTPTGSGPLSNTATVTATTFDPSAINNTSTSTVTVTPVADVAVTETASPNPDGVGQPLTFTITISNNGPSPATGVTLSNPLPAGTTFVSATPSQGTCTAAISCSIGNLAKGATATVTLILNPTAPGTVTNVATVSANETDPVPANNSSSATVQITSATTADLAITNTAPSTATTGLNFNYTVTVKNNGPGQATGVTVTDSFPAGLSSVGATASQGLCTFVAPTLTCTVGTMANAATVTVNISVTPTAIGTVTDTASVTATTPDPNTANNSASATTTVTSSASADLALTKTASVASTHLGAGNFTYTITVTNNGPSSATGVALNDPLPVGVQLVSAPLTTQGTCNANTPISCALGNLANGASATVTITVQAVAIGTAVNTATVSAIETDPNPANNSSSASVQILATADLSLTKTAQPNPVNAGSALAYTLTVTNNGPSAATGVKITDTLPAGATFSSASPACTGNTTVTCTFATLAVNASATATISVTATGSGSLTNTANVSANEFDPNAANNTSSATVTITPVTPVADVAVTETASPDPDGVGQPLTFSIAIVNNGPSPATGVTLSNPLPANTTFVSAKPSQGTCTAAVSCAIGNLAKGVAATVTIILNPTALGTVTNVATVSAIETDPVSANNTATISVPIQQTSDLALTETVNSPILLGANLTYTFTVTNNGPSIASGITLTDTLPSNITFVGTNAPGGVSCNPPVAGTFTCFITGLAVNASAGITVVVKPNLTGTFVNSGTVASGFDPNPANNTASATGIVNGSADLSLTEAAQPQTVNTGSNVTFTFVATNSGPSTATGVTLTDTLPVGMSFVSSTPPVCTAGATVTCNLGTLANGANTTVLIVAKALAAGNFNNAGNVSANEPDPFPSNNTAIASFTAVASADLAVAVSASPNPAAVGVNLTFTTTVTNNGPSPATNVMLVGVLSGQANIVSFTPTQGTCNRSVEFNCSLGNLAAGSTATVTFVVTPTAAGQFGITETVTGNEPDPSTANNSVTLFVNVSSAPIVTLSTPSLNFASQTVGTPSATQSVTLTNTSAALGLSGLTIAASGDFIQTNDCGSGLAALAHCDILVTFKPTATGTRTGAITISDNAVGSPQSVSLTGIGINAPAITLAPGSLVFSSQRVGVSSPALSVTLTNTGNATLNIASIAITGANAADFSQTNTCLQTLAPTISCTVNVVFKPTAGGQRTAGVAITSDARGSVPVVTLSGTGISPGLDLSTPLLVFANQALGSTSAGQTVTVSNAGASAVAVTSITPSGDFAQTNDCGNSVAASGSCAIQVTFTPTATGSRIGAITLVAADSTTPHVVNLSGTGVVVTLSLFPTSLTFNDQKIGTSSQAQSVLLTNTGGAALTINSIVPSGDFLETDTCGNGVAAGAACSINVNFLPSTTGTRSGSISVTSNAQGSPHTIKLTGSGISRGPAVSLSCASGVATTSSCTSLTFPAQAVGTTSGAQQVTLTNIGNDILNIAGVMASGDFAASSCPATLAASASCSISVTFTPTTTGPRAGSLVVKDNAGDSPQSISIAGTGTPSGPSVTLSATALPFGTQFVGTISNLQRVTVTNNGNAAVAFTSIKVSGDFAETDTCANGVPANSSCNISATFTPTAAGARAGAITISDNAPGSPQSVILSGEGTDIIISVPPTGSTSATVSAGQAATFPLLLTPSGGFSDTVTVSCNSAIPASTCVLSPSSFTLDAPVIVTATVTTTAPSHSTVLPVLRLSPREFAPLRVVAQTIPLLIAFLLFFVAAIRRRRTWIAVTGGLFLVAFAAGCAGGSGNPGIIGMTLGTPPNTYTVTIVAKTASGATRTIPLTVIVH